MKFSGYPKNALLFFTKLKKNNKKEWYVAHKGEYEKLILEPSKLLVAELSKSKTLQKFDLRNNEKTPLFRMNRDLRFSSDKSPYKTHNGMLLSKGGTRKENGVLYFHLEPKNVFLAMGFWQPDPRLLARFRLWACENPSRAKALAKKLKKSGLEFESDDALKRLPKGFEHVQDSELGELLKLKHWIVSKKLLETSLYSSKLSQQFEKFAKEAFPLLQELRPFYEKHLLEDIRD